MLLYEHINQKINQKILLVNYQLNQLDMDEIVLSKLHCSFVHRCRNHTSSWESRFRVKGNDFAFTKHRFRLRCSSAPRSLRRASIPLFLAETKSERASERAPHARLRTVSGPLSRSIAFMEEFQVAPSVQRAWNARMVSPHICIGRNSGIPSQDDFRSRRGCSSAAHHDTCLHPRDAFTLIARTSTRDREDRDVTRMIYRSSSNIAVRRNEEDPDEDIRLAIVQNTRGVIHFVVIYISSFFSIRTSFFFLFKSLQKNKQQE